MDVIVTNDTLGDSAPEGSVNVWGLVGVIVFYAMILVIGIYASWKNKSLKSQEAEQVLLAGRSIGLVVGSFTMTATWVGGGYINGTAEIVYTKGVLWAQAPVGYAISLILGGTFFAKKLREAEYVTMLDPFQLKYGSVMTAFLYIPAALGEMFWSAAILSALGASLSVILHMNHDYSIIISAGVVVVYTVIGGLFSVAFTDIIQLICIFIGLWLGVGFALANDDVSSISATFRDNPAWNTDMKAGVTWLGTLPQGPEIGYYCDKFLLLIFGGMPWQVYFQRVLACKDAKTARLLSYLGAAGCFFMTIPAILIGAIGRSADWSGTGYEAPGQGNLAAHSHAMVLPLVLQYLTPTAVAVIGLGAVSAAVMSSADSSSLSSSTMFAHNVYKPARRTLSGQQASDAEILWVMRAGVVVVGVLSTVVAILVKSIYGLFYLCSDLVYVILFPQLATVIYMRKVNLYGSISGYVMGFLFRLLGGEPLLGLPPAVRYPMWHEHDGDVIQNFPFKTFSMLISLLFIVVVSLLTHEGFSRGIIPRRWDVLHCMEEHEQDIIEKPIVDGVENMAYANKDTTDSASISTKSSVFNVSFALWESSV